MGVLDKILGRPSPEEAAREIDQEIASGVDGESALTRPDVRWRLISAAHRVAEKTLDRVRIDPEEFRGKTGKFVMGSEKNPETRDIKFGNINDHLQEMETREIEEERRDARLPDKNFYRMGRFKLQSEVIEAMMLDIGRYIFGKDVLIRVPSVVDDRTNSTDLYVIFRNPDGTIDQVLGLDFTSLPGSERLDRKMRLILRGIVRGLLTTALYLKSRDNNNVAKYYTVRGIARAAIGVSSFTAAKFALNWLQSKKSDPADFVGPEKRAGFLWEILLCYQGQLTQSRAKDARDAKDGKESFATKQLQRAYDRIKNIIDTDVPGVKRDTDSTLKHVLTLVESRERMSALYKEAEEEQVRVDAKIAKERQENPNKRRSWRPKRGY